MSSPIIPMSQLIASDAPLLSPITDDSWDQIPTTAAGAATTAEDSFALSYYNSPPSPPNSVTSACTDSSIPTARMLKMRMSPDSGSESEQQLCLPTHQLFDFPESSSPTPGSPKLQQRPSITINPLTHSPLPPPSLLQSQPQPPQKRSGPGPESAATKKPRASGERISSKDFIPPDVSGLSKREARLVKNRAAAFLSRQRKREEFECMEARVAELEQENARLLALTNNGASSSGPPESEVAISAVEQLRAQLAAAEERERELNAQLARKAATTTAPRDVAVKVESIEPQSPLSRSNSVQAPHKSGASLGLMVLLCALPTLLSMPTQSTLPFASSSSSLFAGSSSSSALDFNSLIPNEYDWSRSASSLMDLDHDDHNSHNRINPSITRARKLEFVDDKLGGLDISFDTSHSDDGKIRVRIHSPVPSALSSLESSSAWSTIPSLEAALSSSPDSYYTGDPFLGVGSSASSDSSTAMMSGSSGAFGLGSHYASDGTMSMYDELSSSSIDFGQFGLGGNEGLKKRRVRIALKSFPAVGGEGGEWEVQIC